MDEVRYRKALELESAGKRKEAVVELRDLLKCSANHAADGFVFAALAENLRVLGHALEARSFVAWAYSVLDKEDTSFPYIMYADALVDGDLKKRTSEIEKLDLLVARYGRLLEKPEHEALRNCVLLNKGIGLTLLGRYAEARPLLETAVILDLDPSATLFHLGNCCFRLRDYEPAERYLRQVTAMELDAAHAARAHYTLAIVCYQRGRYAWARQELEWCLENGGEHLEKDTVVKAIVASSKALGLDEDMRRFSRLLRNP